MNVNVSLQDEILGSGFYYTLPNVFEAYIKLIESRCCEEQTEGYTAAPVTAIAL